jgi:hypothetical protein
MKCVQQSAEINAVIGISPEAEPHKFTARSTLIR